ncbi:MAG: divergent polysaccharide deacetylase family protein, partial [Acetobacteraceae bacterium]|nr:divergent polysaccharide deacetylase family protein [Acetobacteraceae bacterium]
MRGGRRIRWPGLTLRPLGLFWVALAVLGCAGAVALQFLGPPPAPAVTRASDAGRSASMIGVRAVPPRSHFAGAPRGTAKPGRISPGPIPPPDPALLEAATDVPGGGMLPRIAADGRAPMSVYAHGFPPPNGAVPRVGLLVAGIGLNAGDGEDAARMLPGAVTFAVSPYASNLPKLLDLARATEHECVVSVPMEPADYPADDPGPQALLRDATPAQNGARLHWALARISGYVGATGALGALRGERFADAAAQMDPVLRQIAARGLIYIDPRPGAAPPAGVWGRSVDVVIDEPANRPEI